MVKDGIIKRQSLELEAFRKAARLGLARSQGEFREDQGLQAAEDSTEVTRSR